jgi:ubiquitin conjugation factor E4 B
VLDEGLSRLPLIHDLEREIAENGQLTAEEKRQKEDELDANEHQAKNYMALANESMATMKLFTNALSEAFTMPEIVSRLAGMLDYNLVTLAGPKSRNLKVTNPEKYLFNPRTLLPDLIDIYLNLGSRRTFIEAVAGDGRSYKPEIFDNASRILAGKGLMDSEKLAAWDSLKAKFAKAKELADQAEQDYGEVPDEFEDPITGDIMKDPVILPSSQVVDRSTIIQHLLSDPKDPFTRQPMTIDDARPNDELREKIEAWKKERIAAAKGVINAADAMDTTEG